MKYSNMKRTLSVLATLAIGSSAHAQAVLTVSDDFTQTSAQNNWATFDGACLTAGNGSGGVPACIGRPHFQGQTLVGGTSGTLPDTGGSGALRLTNGFTQGHGSGFAFGFNHDGGTI